MPAPGRIPVPGLPPFCLPARRPLCLPRSCPVAAMMLLLALVFGLAVLPQMWVRKTIARHSRERPDFPGTGGEFARHILDEMKLSNVRVEETKLGDHYDPETKTVRLPA